MFPSTSTSVAPFKIIQASFVTAESGTGLVHCAPAHGGEDYAAFRSLGLLQENKHGLVCHVNGAGRFSEDVCDIIGKEQGGHLSGLNVLGNGTDAVIEMLQAMGNVLLKEERIKHRYPYDWKTDKPVIVT